MFCQFDALVMEGDPAVDLVETLAQVQGDRALLTELVELSRAESSSILAEIQRCVACGCASGLERAAHRLRGSVSVFGARALARVALSLEVMGRDQHLAGAAVVLDDLERELSRFDRELAQFGTGAGG